MTIPTFKRLLNPSTWSIRWRLTLWYTSCVMLILTVAGVVVYYGFRASIIADTDRSLTICAADIIGQMTNGDRIKLTGHYFTPPPNPEIIVQRARTGFNELEFDSSGDPVYLRLINTYTGQLEASSSNIMPHGFVEERLSRASVDDKTSVKAFFIDAGMDNELRVLQVTVPRSPYILQLASPWARNENRLNPVGGTIVWIVAVFVIVSGLGGWALVGRTLQPINEIVSEAKKMRGSELEPAFVAARTHGEDELGHLVQALNEMMARVHRAVAMQRQFTADASHDLRTPLTILRGEMEYALARPRTSEQYQEALRTGLDATERLIRIVSDLSALAAADSHEDVERHIPATSIDIAELCRSILQSRQGEAEARGITVTFRDECRQTDAVVFASPTAMERAVANVIDNAIKYNKTHGSVEVVVGKRDADITIDVIDTGIGISENDKPYIFDRFYRSDRARRSGEELGYGSSGGLGLAIAQYVVASCGGSLNVSSKVDQGSRFTISLPVQDEG